MRVLITGSRDWQGSVTVYDALAALVAEAGDVLTVVHGDCPSGADRMARGWCEAMGPVLRSQGISFYEERHPAQWNVFGKQAGFKRNADMVNLGADLCLAFIRNQSRGASHTAHLAFRAHIELRVFREQD